MAKFFNRLIDYVIESLIDVDSTLLNNVPRKAVKSILSGNNNVFTSINAQHFKQTTVTFVQIKFPGRKDVDMFDYLPLLKKFGSLRFHNCEFNTTYLDVNDCKCHFSECHFNSDWCVFENKLLSYEDSTYYQCYFHKKVFSNPENEREYLLSNNLFQECNFKEKVEFVKVKFEGQIFYNQYDKHELHSLTLSGCQVVADLLIHDMGEAYWIKLSDTVFKAKFYTKNA